MKVRVDPRGGPRGELFDITARLVPEDLHADQFLCGLTEHDLRDLESVLAERRAMGRVCGAEQGEHTCASAPDDNHLRHLCRGCTHEWPRTPGGS